MYKMYTYTHTHMYLTVKSRWETAEHHPPRTTVNFISHIRRRCVHGARATSAPSNF